MSGITDPYALYKRIHRSEVGTSLGTGGTVSLAKMFKDRRDEKEVHNDIFKRRTLHPAALGGLPDRSWFQFHQYYGWLSTCFSCPRVVLSKSLSGHG